MGTLFSDVRHSLATMARLQNRLDDSYVAKPTPLTGVALTGNAVAVGGQVYKMEGAWDLDVRSGEAVEVVNGGRAANAFYRFNTQRRLRDHLPYQNVEGLMVVEEDGTPAVFDVKQIVVSNGSMTDNGGGSISLTMGGAGASWHQVYVGLARTLTTAVPGGPTNRSGKTWTIKTISLTCNTSCTFNVAGNALTLGAGGGTTTLTGLTTTVAVNAQLAISCSAMGAGGTALDINIYFEAA